MLELDFSARAGRVEISSDQHHSGQLQRLRARFATGATISALAFEVELEDLLLNLAELTVWPEDDLDVRWDPELLALAETNAVDAQTFRAGLETGGKVAFAEAERSLRLASAFVAPLTEFQHRDIDSLLRLTHGANFSVPGAGKTRVALSIFLTRRDAGQVHKMLVICPKPAFESWLDEVALCFPTAAVRIAVMGTNVVPVADIVLLNYERLPDAVPTLIGWLRAHRTLLVLDEAHRMKLGPQGAWGAACLALAPYATRRLILTGTPAPNGARDLENLFAFVWPGQGRRTVSRALSGGDLRDASRELRPFFVRTTKAELHLPPMEIRVRRVELPPLHRELYDALLGQVSRSLRTGGDDLQTLGRVVLYLLMAATTPALLATGASRYEPLPYRVPPLQPPPGSTLADLLRDLPDYELSPKYKEVVRLVAENAEQGRKTLVWSTFIRNLTSLETLLARFAPAIVHGGTEDRTEQLKRFRTDPKCLVLLSNPSTLGEGVSLHHACHDAVYIDRDFAAGRFLQSLDRIHRLGLAPDVRTTATVLVATNTIDEIVERRLTVKLRFLGGILDDPEVLELGDLADDPDFAAGMDVADVAELIGYVASSAPG